MLLWLSEYLVQYESGFNVFQYITVRTILGALTSLFIALLVGPPLIAYLGKYQIGQAVNLFGSYAQSSRAPTPVELTCADPDDPCRLPNAFVSDPPLDQIVATTWEAGVRGGRGPFDFTIAAFASGASDDIIFVSSGRLRGQGHFENVAQTRRRGIEASFEYEAGGASVYGAYTLQRATYGADLHLSSPLHPLADAGEIAVDAVEVECAAVLARRAPSGAGDRSIEPVARAVAQRAASAIVKTVGSDQAQDKAALQALEAQVSTTQVVAAQPLSAVKTILQAVHRRRLARA